MKSLFHPISSLHSYSKSGFNIGCQFVGPLDVHTWISVPRQHLAWNAFTSKGALDVATNMSDMCSKISWRFQLTVDSYVDLCHWTEETWQQDVPIMLRLSVVEQLPCLWLVPHVRDLRGVGNFSRVTIGSVSQLLFKCACLPILETSLLDNTFPNQNLTTKSNAMSVWIGSPVGTDHTDLNKKIRHITALTSWNCTQKS